MISERPQLSSDEARQKGNELYKKGKIEDGQASLW